MQPAYKIDQRGIRQVIPRPSKWLRPDRVAVEYYRFLKGMVNYLEELTRQILIPALPKLTKETEGLRPDSDDILDWPINFEVDQFIEDAFSSEKDFSRSDLYDLLLHKSGIHLDQGADEVERLITDIDVKFAKIYTPEKIENAVVKTGQDINRFNANQFQKVMHSVLDVNVFVAEPWLANEMKLFVRDNIALIKSIKSDYLSQVETITYRGMRAGQRHEDIAREVKKRFGVTRNRAKLIARDQVNKFNGQLTQLRQQSAGIEKYRWWSAGDNRVRPRHQERDGNVYSWKDSPIPGSEISCRCTGAPVFNEEVFRRFKGEEVQVVEAPAKIPTPVRLAKPRKKPVPTISEVEKKIAKNPVASNIKTKKNQKYYIKSEEEYVKFFDDIGLPKTGEIGDDTWAKLTSKYDELVKGKYGETSRNLLFNWQLSTSDDMSLAFRIAAQTTENTSSLIWNMNPVAIPGTIKRVSGLLSQNEYLKLRAFNQAYMKRRGIRKVKLYRGTSGDAGIEVGKKITEGLKNKTITKASNVDIVDNSIVSYSSDKKIAESFVGEKGGMAINIDVPAEEIIIHRDLLSGFTNNRFDEREYIILGKPRNVKIGDIEIFKPK